LIFLFNYVDNGMGVWGTAGPSQVVTGNSGPCTIQLVHGIWFCYEHELIAVPGLNDVVDASSPIALSTYTELTKERR